MDLGANPTILDKMGKISYFMPFQKVLKNLY